MSKITFEKVYHHAGKALCGVAGAVVGYVSGGIFLAIPLAIGAVLVGNFIEKSISPT